MAGGRADPPPPRARRRGALRAALLALELAVAVAVAAVGAAGARPELPTWLGESFRNSEPGAAAGLAAADAAPRAILETPHDCRLSRLHPRLQAFITGPLRHYQNVEWRQNGVEPGRIIITRGGLIYSIVELDTNPGDVQDLLHNHGILPGD